MSSNDWADKDFYKVLGVSKDAKPEDIKKAFRKIARDNHPDQHPGDKAAEQRFKEASEAHDVLSDPEKRKEYDQQRMFAGLGGGFRFPRGGGQGSNVRAESFNMSDTNLSDLLGGLFGTPGAGGGGGRRNSRSRRGADVEGQVSISFAEAIAGTTVSVQLMGEEACKACRGTGAKPGTQPRVCPTCQGSGAQQPTSGGVFAFSQTCADCGGRGVIIDEPCEICHGAGRTTSTRSMQVRIPAGVEDGQRIRVKGRGNPGQSGGEPGDLYVVVNVAAHPVFGRAGNDLTVKVPVTFPEAALGAEIEVPTLNGPNVKLRLAAGTPNGRVLRVRDKGVKKGAKTGDLLAEIEVQVPDKLDPTARAALEAYRDAVNEPSPRTELLAKNRSAQS